MAVSHKIITVLAVAILVTVSNGQQQNYEEDIYQDRPARQQRPQQASFSRPSISQQATGPKPIPIAILKQINRHNEDGSYTYGYEGADGSFKIETKLATGEVMGKYGYVDDVGKVRVVEYGANKFGFMPSGEGITVAPPTLVDETTDKNGNRIPDDDEVPAPRPKLHRKPTPVRQYQDYEDEYSSVPQQQHHQPQHHQPQHHQPQHHQPQHHQPQHHHQPQQQQHFAPPAPIFTPVRPIPSHLSAVRQNSGSPVPPRPAVIPGAAPVFSSAPVQQPRPAPRIPVPQQPQQQQYYQPKPRPQAVPARGSRILDQLEKDYALPPSSAFTHDITFGSY